MTTTLHARRQNVVPNRWAIFVVGLIAQIVFSGTFLGLPTASALFQGTFGFSIGELALFLGAASLAVVITEAPWGIAADRYGERRVLIIGIATSATFLVALAAVSAVIPSPPVWILAGLLFLAAGAGGAVTGPSGSAILGWFDARRHGTLVSLRVAAVPLGGAIGTAAYSLLLAQFGAAVTFVAVAATCAATGTLVAIYAHDPPQRTNLEPSGTARKAVRDVGVWRVAGSGFLLDVTQFLVLTFATTIMTQLFDIPLAVGLISVTAMQLVGGLVRVLAGVGTDFVPWLSRPLVVRMFCLAQVLCLMPFLWSGLLPAPLGVALLIMAGIAGCAWQGAHFSHIAGLAGPTEAGTALGLNNAATSSGAFAAQIIAGTFAATFDWQTTILVLGAIPALLACLIFPGRRQPPRNHYY